MIQNTTVFSKHTSTETIITCKMIKLTYIKQNQQFLNYKNKADNVNFGEILYF